VASGAGAQEYDLYWAYAYHKSECYPTVAMACTACAALCRHLPEGDALLLWCLADAVRCANAGLWDRYHVHSVLQRTEANLWWKEQFDAWNPCAEFDTEEDRGYWAVRNRGTPA
jgi:hypothetical protein